MDLRHQAFIQISDDIFQIYFLIFYWILFNSFLHGFLQLSKSVVHSGRGCVVSMMNRVDVAVLCCKCVIYVINRLIYSLSTSQCVVNQYYISLSTTVLITLYTWVLIILRTESNYFIQHSYIQVFNKYVCWKSVY